MYFRGRHLLVLGGMAALAIAVGVLGGAATTGRAATTQQVTAGITCVPGETADASTIGCTLTVSNIGGNNVTSVVVTDQASNGGTFLSSSSSKCTPSGSTLTCNIGKLTGVGTAGAIFSETHELQMPGLGTTVVQTITGRYSPNPNNRGGDVILAPPPLETTVNSSGDFDARFANANGESVQTNTSLSDGNPYSSGAVLVGTTGFAVGLSVQEQDAEAGNPNCPVDGCFNDQVVEFEITALPGTGTDLTTTSYTLTIRLLVPNGTQPSELDVRHDGELLRLCPLVDSVGACMPSTPTISNGNPKIAAITITGPGDGNGSVGVG